MEDDRAPGSTFGSLLRSFRLAANLSQEALAERARMSTVGVGALERGDRQAPYRNTVARLAEALALSPEDRARLERASAHPRRLASVPSSKIGAGTAAESNNLPLTPTSFLGRAQALNALRELVPKSRLVSVIGAGGVGKTRLALETARSLVDGFADGVWFVGLAPVADARLLARTVAHVLGVSHADDESAERKLIDWLRNRHALLVLDNCEHVVESAAAVVNAILQSCPRIAVLVTSREGLKVPGEQIYRLPSLAAPARGVQVAALAARRFDAVALFVERAHAANPDFVLTDENAQTIANLTRRLDGLPLAIELAAARAGVMPVAALEQRLDERFRLLAGGNRTALPRQQTLRGAIDWSYDLLSAQERLLLDRLGTFSGGVTLEAVEVVCSDEHLRRSDALGVLSSLVEKSLVAVELRPDSSRYSLLESTRAYALEKLALSGDRQALARRHALWVDALVEDIPERSWAERDPSFLHAVRPEIDNIRAALRWTLEDANDDLLGAKIAGNLASFWFRFAPSEGRRWIEIALKRVDPVRHPDTMAQLFLGLSVLTYAKRSAEYAESAVAQFERLDDPCGLARALTVLADAQQETGQISKAGVSLRRALELFAREGLAQTWRVAIAQAAHGRLLSLQGKAEEARACFAGALAIGETLADEMLVARTLVEQADAEFAAGNVEQARTVALDLAHRPGLSGTDVAAAALVNAAAYALGLDDVAAAKAAAREGLQRARELHLRNLAVFAMQHLAAGLAREGDAERAARLSGYLDAWFVREGFRREPTEEKSYEILSAALRSQLPAAEIAALAASGCRFDDERAMEEAMALTAAP